MLKWLFRRKQTEDDFEGRCEGCAKRLDLEVTVITSRRIILDVIPCKDHPKDAMILWPQRKDLIRRYPKNFIAFFDKNSTQLKLEVKAGLVDYHADKD